MRRHGIGRGRLCSFEGPFLDTNTGQVRKGNKSRCWNPDTVQLALVLPRQPDERWQLARQIGVTDAVVHPLEVGDDKTHWSYDDLLGTKNWLEDAGLNFTVLEGSVPLTDRIRLGRDGRDEDIAEFKQFLRDCGDRRVPRRLVHHQL